MQQDAIYLIHDRGIATQHGHCLVDARLEPARHRQTSRAGNPQRDSTPMTSKHTTPTVHIRTSHTIVDLPLATSPLQLSISTPFAHVIQVRRHTDQELERGKRRSDCTCIASASIEIQEGDLSTLTSIASGQAFPNANEQNYRSAYTNASGQTTYLPSLDKFPSSFRTSVADPRDELNRSTRQAIDILRWRLNCLGPTRNFLSSMSDEWSIDGLEWHCLPSSITAIPTIRSELRVTTDALKEVVEAAHNPPPHLLPYELLREAMELQSKQPRSAVIIALAAVEIATKGLVARSLPETAWLVENIPTPPINRILREYAPNIQTPAGHSLKIPKEILRSHQSAVKLRNQITHTSQPAPSITRARQILSTASDILRLIDAAEGYSWADTLLQNRSI